jgi:hypothetical protein
MWKPHQADEGIHELLIFFLSPLSRKQHQADEGENAILLIYLLSLLLWKQHPADKRKCLLHCYRSLGD